MRPITFAVVVCLALATLFLAFPHTDAAQCVSGFMMHPFDLQQSVSHTWELQVGFMLAVVGGSLALLRWYAL
jgi:hypothetical protein